jgi:hypothetical protein
MVKRNENWADRSLHQSQQELKMLKSVMTKYADDENGKRKMLKKMKRYYRSTLAEINRIDYKPNDDRTISNSN